MKVSDQQCRSTDFSKVKVVIVSIRQAQIIQANPTASHLNMEIRLPDGENCLLTTPEDSEKVLRKMVASGMIDIEDLRNAQLFKRSEYPAQ